MAIVYRVENNKGKGPYTGVSPRVFENSFLNVHGRGNGHPTPLHDPLINRQATEGELCYFESIKQACEWFTPLEFFFMYKRGFTLREVEVQKITAVGQKQVLAIGRIKSTPIKYPRRENVNKSM